jgi:hypothetical protein
MSDPAWAVAHDTHRERRQVTVTLIDGREFVGHVVGMTGGRDGSLDLDVDGLTTTIGWRYVRTIEPDSEAPDER